METKSRFLSEPKTVGIVGCPFRGGQLRAGVDQGPIYLVQAGLAEQIEDLGWKVKFDGHHLFEGVERELALSRDEDVHGIVKNPKLVSRVCQAVSKSVEEHAKKGELPLTLGGDHSLAVGTVSGIFSAYPDACLIWCDAHADINTVESTESGNMHGMPVSFLLGIGSKLPMFDWLRPVLKPERMVYIGLRDVDKAEKTILKDHGIKAFSMHEVDKYGIGKVVEMALDHVNPQRNLPIHLSFDVDALDPSVAPSTGTPVRGGLTFREGHYICEAICETGLLVGLDIMEVNPSLPNIHDKMSVEQTVAIGCSLTRASLGRNTLSCSGSR
ncbi:arginase [Dacryopinax primogenitus]|uniref:Arginase n=1 Tax=Dacryopinax primogenitus (strain DJM 731) TaxID=1858805 RepID=M5FY51_DACPD|nr:arginase [Dacryopinax primogenitus]EJU00720.1 arginase [Dacryopinax primogenitus]